MAGMRTHRPIRNQKPPETQACARDSFGKTLNKLFLSASSGSLALLWMDFTDHHLIPWFCGVHKKNVLSNNHQKQVISITNRTDPHHDYTTRG